VRGPIGPPAATARHDGAPSPQEPPHFPALVYTSRQTRSVSRETEFVDISSFDMNWNNTVPIVVALLGIVSALVGGYFAGRRQAQLEHHREARLAVAELTRSMSVAAHTISWFTWKAKHRAQLLTQSDAREYDDDMKTLFPALTGALAVVAAFSPAAYKRAREVADDLYSLDERVADAATAVLTQQENASAALADLHPEARRLEAASKTMAEEVMKLCERGRSTLSLHWARFARR
jgi:hypothetical protein